MLQREETTHNVWIITKAVIRYKEPGVSWEVRGALSEEGTFNLIS